MKKHTPRLPTTKKDVEMSHGTLSTQSTRKDKFQIIKQTILLFLIALCGVTLL